MAAYHIPGAAIAIVHNGEVEYINGFGIASAAGEAVTPDTPFLLASVSKSFTGAAVMQLVEAGRISLDAPVQQYLPWFTVGGGRITVAQLVYQTSGFSEVGGNEATGRPDSPDALEDGVRSLTDQDLIFTPGEDWEYSNLNYDVLGLIVQEVSGQSYESYIEDHIFAPLGMTHSYTSMTAARSGGAASGYYPFFGISLVYDQYMPYSRATLPAGGLWSSASDMSRYLMAHLDDGTVEGASILSAAGITTLHDPGFMVDEGQGYAMGWKRNSGFVTPDLLDRLQTDWETLPNLSVVFHDGEWANYRAVAFMIPEAEYGEIILLNTNNPSVSSAFTAFAWDIALIANGAEPVYFPPGEVFAVRYARWIFSLVVLLLIGELVWTARMLKRGADGSAPPGHRTRTLIHLVIMLAVDAALIFFVFFMLLPDNATTLPDLLRIAPDMGLLALLVALLAGVWGAIRTGLLTLQLRSV